METLFFCLYIQCALEILGWNRNDVTFIITGRLWLLQNVDNSWNKKYTSLKYTSVHGFLIAQGKVCKTILENTVIMLQIESLCIQLYILGMK